MQMPEYSGGGGDGKKWNYSSSMCSNSNSKCTRSSVNNAVVDDDSDITTTVTTTLKVTNSSCCRRSIMAVSEAAIGSRSVATMFIVFASVLLLITVTDVRASSSSNYVVPTTPMTPDVVSSTVIPAAIIKESQNRSANSNNGRWYSKLSTGNELWDGIIQDCYHRPMISCFQKNVYTFLDGALDSSDVNVTGRLKLFKNKVDYTKYTVEANNGEQRNHQHGDGDDEHLDETNEIPNESRAAESPIEEVTNALYGKSVKFVMTHDVELKLPEMVFDGATFRISPRSIEGNGAIVKLELVPKAEVEARDAGKFFIKKKIQKFFKSKLMLSFLALILILKIIKIKIFWLLPLIVGVGTAKKLLLKFLLFLFPALSHLFKLCSYYQQEYHSTKYHHHHHLINHHHTIVPPWHHAEGSAHIPNIAHVSHGPPPHGHGHGHGHAPEIIYTDPPKVHPSAFLHGAHGHGGTTHDDYGANDWVSSGPGLGSEYISDINRSAQVDGNYFKPKPEDAHELHAWGLGTTSDPNIQQHYQQQQQQRPPPQQQQQPTSQNFNTHPFTNDPQSQSFVQGKVRIQGPVYVPQRSSNVAQQAPSQTAAQIAAQYDPNRNKQITPELSAQVKEALRIEAEKRIISQQQEILDKQPFIQGGPPIMPKNYDEFYTPILDKIDKILGSLGFVDNHCKERLTCSMYKNPIRFSPHSNFLSAELSRDTSELQTPDATNPTVIRFYRLVDAARNGQEQRDCLRLYAQCSVNTEL
ncbi:uncharacterized protein LOC129914487 isoform X1 [Episyrphus balteatus]|uniref:uncharacterized protein LOC129914487 isoform X1 n=1 Tax=Episyrphus balteatus TaxID=286459 RepID=UPI002486CB2B|nr:uncharacterized protein LOC129914487 isoform X1 [Episyrphus balteatus]